MVLAEIGSHVFTVEFHVYLYHLLDALPDYDLPKLEGSSNGAEHSEKEEIEVRVTKSDGYSKTYEKILFPKRFNDVLDFYMFDLDPIFFPSYEYHTLSKEGVVLKHAVIQSYYNNELYMYIVPELMVNVDLHDIKFIQWTALSNNRHYYLELCDVAPKMKTPIVKELSFGISSERQPIITPTSVDLRPICPPIQNQGDLGTCGVAALTSFLEFITHKRLSVLFVYYVTRVLIRGHLGWDDSGVEVDDCCTALAKYGVCSDEEWPYDTAKFPDQPSPKAFEQARQFRPTSFKRLHNIDEMKQTLRSGLAFFCDINFAPASYCRLSAETGKIPGPRSLEELDPDSCEHTVMIVGYNDDTQEFIFQNSWGSQWGQKGYGFLPAIYLTPGMFRNALTWHDPKTIPVPIFNN